MTTYVLLPSPLVGRATWDSVASRLHDADDVSAVVADPGTSTRPEEVLAAFVASAGSIDDEVVLVPHSNAGYYAPLVADAVDAAAIVYVDAALPAPEGSTRLAPPELEEMLASLVDEDGLLPPWSHWWSDDVEALFPQEEARQRVEATMPRLPLAYFRASIEAPPGWEQRSNAYLAFGDTYGDELRRARALGWPVHQIQGPHLFPVWDPETSAAAIRMLHRRLG